MNGIEIVEQREQQTTQDHHEHMDAELRTRFRHARRSLMGYVEEVLDLMDDEEEGNIRIYHLCRICTDSIMVIGIGDAARGEDSEIVVI